jgi:hypothetical protein
MQIFEYVIVLSSIVIGLAVTHLMQGIAGMVQHPGRARVWWSISAGSHCGCSMLFSGGGGNSACSA